MDPESRELTIELQKGEWLNSTFFQNMVENPELATRFDNTQQEIEYNEMENQISIRPMNYPRGGIKIQTYMVWHVAFRAQGHYENLKIEGLLQFPNDYPNEAPKFFLGRFVKKGAKAPINNWKVFQHVNVYQDSSLCMPVTAKWKKSTSEFALLQAIIGIFNNPNRGNPANLAYQAYTKQEEEKLINQQKSWLDEWKEDI